MQNQMKMKTKTSGVILMILALALGGCNGMDFGSTVTQLRNPDGSVITTTTKVNNSDMHDYYEGAVKHKQSDSAKLVSMTTSVMGSKSCENCTDEGKAWAGAFKMLIVGYGTNFASEKYTAEKAKGVWDVTETIVNGAVKIATGGILTYGDFNMGAGSSGGYGEGLRVDMGDGSSFTGSFTEQVMTNTATTLEGNPTSASDPSASLDSSSSEDNDSSESNIQ